MKMIALLLVGASGVSSLAAYRLANQTATSLRECFDLCGAAGQLPVCVASTSHHERVLTATKQARTWLSNTYDPSTGQTVCPSGHASGFTSWAAQEPNAMKTAGVGGCTTVIEDKWYETPCVQVTASCLCGPSGPISVGYLQSLTERETEARHVQMEDAAQNTLALAVAGAVWAAIFVASVGGVRLHLHRVNTRHQAEARAVASPTTLLPPTEARGAGEQADEEDEELAKRAAATLNSARDAARRVRRTLDAAGFALTIVSNFILLPFMFFLMFNALPWGPVGVFVFSIGIVGAVCQADPMQPRQFRMQPGMATGPMPFINGFFAFLAMYVALAPHFIGCSTRYQKCALTAQMFSGALWLTVALNAFAGCVMVPRALYTRRDKVLPPVKELLRQQRKVVAEGKHPWYMKKDRNYLLEGAGYFEMPVRDAMDLFFGFSFIWGPIMGTTLVTVGILMHVLAEEVAPAWMTWGGLVPLGLTMIFIYPTICSAPVRRVVIAWLGRLGTHEEERQAAAVAGLMGELNPAKALSIAKSTFRGLSFSSLRQEDLESNADTGLNGRTVKLALGSCHAFMSHSWHDSASAKFAALQGWAAKFEASKSELPLLWLDKACIDQSDIPSSLACLPVYLAGCETLLVLSGATYIERLWCVVEVFTFVRMGGALERIDIVPLSTGLNFELFAVEHAKCFDPNDKARLLSAIEAAFGSHAPFNVLVRSLLRSANGEDKNEPKVLANAKKSGDEVLSVAVSV